MCRTVRTEAIALVRKRRVQSRLQDLQDGLLHHAVPYRRYPQLPDSAGRLGNLHSAHRAWQVVSAKKLRRYLIHIRNQARTKLFHGHTVHARRTPVGHHALQRPYQVPSTRHLLHQMLCSGRAFVSIRRRSGLARRTLRTIQRKLQLSRRLPATPRSEPHGLLATPHRSGLQRLLLGQSPPGQRLLCPLLTPGPRSGRLTAHPSP